MLMRIAGISEEPNGWLCLTVAVTCVELLSRGHSTRLLVFLLSCHFSSQPSLPWYPPPPPVSCNICMDSFHTASHELPSVLLKGEIYDLLMLNLHNILSQQQWCYLVRLAATLSAVSCRWDFWTQVLFSQLKPQNSMWICWKAGVAQEGTRDTACWS